MSEEDYWITDNTNMFSLFSNPAPLYMIYKANNVDLLVSINLADGSIIFGPNYKPDEAAQIFWSSITHEFEEYLKWKKENSQK